MSTMSDDPLVLVTGAAGYIATHVVQQLQQRGYRVRATVRSTNDEDKIRALLALCPAAKHSLELVEAELTKDEDWGEAVAGCQYVVHTASPLPSASPKNDDELIRPAVEGTLSVLRACRATKTVKRVVLTSSMAAIWTGVEDGEFTEENWTDPGKTPLPYYKSKVLAERAAWDFVAGLSADEKFELVALNPGYVLGPVLCGGYASSMNKIIWLMQNEIPAALPVSMAIVDVRDVATAHVNALTIPDAAGKRHVLTTGNLWMKEVAVILADEFAKMGYEIPTGEAPISLLKVEGYFGKDIKRTLPQLGVNATFDNARMRTVLKIDPRAPKDTILDMAYSMIERGFIRKSENYKNVNK